MLKILVDTAMIQQAQAEYDKLSGQLSGWRTSLETNDTKLVAANCGVYQETFHKKSQSFTTGTMSELENQVKVTGKVLEDAHRKAKGLVARSVDFVSILRGEEDLGDAAYESADTNGVTILKFEDSYCSQIKDDSEQIDELSTKEEATLEELESTLGELQSISLDVSGDISVIDECLDKQKRVMPLNTSLVSYGKGVNALNSYVSSTLRANCNPNAVGAGRKYKGANFGGYLTMNLATANWVTTIPMMPTMPGGLDPESMKILASMIGATVSELATFLKGYIPQNWSNETIAKAMDALVIPTDFISRYRHYKKNPDEIKKVYTRGKYIENQYEWDKVKYGETNMQHSGCGIIAMINAYRAMGKSLTEEEIAQIIRKFEKNGGVIRSYAGSSPKAIENYLRKNTDYGVETTTSADKSKIEKFAKNNDTVIALVYNDEKDISAGMHYVNIQKVKKKDGSVKYVVHNGGTNGKEFDSIDKALKGMGANTKPIKMIGLKKVKKGRSPKGSNVQVS